jgi:uncharacterized protein YbaP (TraB family)
MKITKDNEYKISGVDERNERWLTIFKKYPQCKKLAVVGEGHLHGLFQALDKEGWTIEKTTIGELLSNKA